MNYKEELILEISKKVINEIIKEGVTKKNTELVKGKDVAKTDQYYWNCIYNLMDNVKKTMTITKQDKGQITAEDVQNIISYIELSISNIMK